MKRAIAGVALLALAGCGTQAAAITSAHPAPTVTKTVTRIVYRTKVITKDVPVPGPTVTVPGQYQYDSQDPFWNCWGDLINGAPYSAYCETNKPN